MALPIIASDASSLNPTIFAAPTSATTLATNPTSMAAPTDMSGAIAASPALTDALAAASTTSGSSSVSGTDQRVRLAHLSGYANPYPGILAPLQATQGLMFPYSPGITQSHDVDYTAMAMVHSNQDYYAYAKTPNVSINLTAKFTVQNRTEGLYALAAIHFLRSASKMNFGQNDPNKGLPPPILTLTGYGEYMYNGVRCILKGSSVAFDETIDKVKVTAASGSVWLPALFTVSLSLIVQQTANAMRTRFTLDAYRDGSLLVQGGWL